MSDPGSALQAALPSGLRVRSLAFDDVAVATALVAACEQHDDGVAEINESDIAAVWSQPSVNLEETSIGVFDHDVLVAGGEVLGERAELDVHPAWRGRGIGRALMRWSWERARADGQLQVGQSISDNRRDAAAMFAAHGYRQRWTSWILHIDMTDRPAASELPAGYRIRGYVPGDDDHDAYRVIDTAFNEWPDREPTPFANWHALTVGSDAFAPWASPVLLHEGAMVGAALGFDHGPDSEGWTQQLAVDAAHRGRGLGKALLVESFRRFWDDGRRRCGLSTDSRTGALALYQHAGMSIRRSYTRWSKTLDG